MHKHANKKLVDQRRSRDREDYFNNLYSYDEDNNKKRTKMRQENHQKLLRQMLEKENKRKELGSSRREPQLYDHPSFNTYDDSYFKKALKFLDKTERREQNINSKSAKKMRQAMEKILGTMSISKERIAPIMKLTGAILVACCASEALADFNLDTGIKAAIKPFHDSVTKYWPFGVGLPAVVGAFVGEGDMRTRGKNAGIGALVGGGVTLGLLGAMGVLV